MAAPRILPLFDERARPSSWNERMAAGEYAVHESHLDGSREGGPVCTVFASLAEAEAHAQRRVAETSDLRCRIYDHQGFVGAPLREFRGSGYKGEGEVSRRFRRWVGSIMLFGGLLLIALDWSYEFSLSWPAMLGSRMLLPGVVLLVTEAVIVLLARRKAGQAGGGVSLVLIQMAVVLSVTLLCGAVARRLGQSRVVGEIVGGILLGPSLLGRVAPHAAAALFPARSLGALEVLSGLGLVLFLFLMGLEMDHDHLRRHKATATLASALGILLPFLMAIFAAPLLYSRFAPVGTGRPAFTLFLGIAMSITALPVLARILEERGLQSTSLGATAMMCAAVDDVCAWLLLAFALTLLPTGGGGLPIAHRFVWFGLYLAVMVFAMRPLANWLARRRAEDELSYELFAVAMAFVLTSSAATEAIGVHPLFGAFLAGLCFPRVKKWQASIRARLDMATSVLLLPLFFALTGIRTRLDLLHGAAIWGWTAVVLLIAMAGKIGGAVLAARWTGQSRRDAWALGVLLNTRGLVELIVLNIAYNAGVFSPTLFTMLVVMALATTAATNPLLNLVGTEDGHI